MRFERTLRAAELTVSLAASGGTSYLVLADTAGGSEARIVDGELGGVSRYEFADGAVLDHAQLMAEAQSDGLGLTGSGTADRLIGSRAADSLSGGAGADVLQGQGGDDAYLFNLGDGQDRIDDPEGRNVLRFGPGIAPASVSLVNYPEGWSLLAYGDQGPGVKFPAGLSNSSAIDISGRSRWRYSA